MRFRSSGLGKQELKGNMSDVSLAGDDLFVCHIETYEPVQWHLRAALEFGDIPKILKAILKPSVFFLLVRTLFYIKNNPQEPEDIMGDFP